MLLGRTEPHLQPPEAAVGDFKLGPHACSRTVVAEAEALAQGVGEGEAQEAGVPCLCLQLALQPPQPRPLRAAARLEPVLLRLRSNSLSKHSRKSSILLEAHQFKMGQTK